MLRVKYPVPRPPSCWNTDDIRALRDQLTDLQGKVTTLQKEINEKLDQLLMRKV